MPWLARSHLEAPSPSSSTSTTEREKAKAKAPSPAHCHRRRFSSVADDYHIARRVSKHHAQGPIRSPRTSLLSPLSPRWSVASVAEEEEEEENDTDLDDVNIEDDDEDDTTSSDTEPSSPIHNSPSYRNSVLSMASTSTTSTLRRYWSPTSSPRPASRQRPLSQSSSPSYRSQLSVSPTLTPGTSTAPSSSPSTAPSTASTAPSTAPSTSYMAENNTEATSNTAFRPSAPITSDHVVTYIPPLVDGAGGTLSRWQRIHQQGQQQQTLPPSDTFRIKRISSNSNSPSENTAALTPYRLLWSDLRWLATSSPELLRLAWNKASTPVWAVARPRVWSRLLTVPVDDITDAAEALLQAGLAIAEVAMLAAAPTLFLCLPGGLFLVWLMFCFAAVYSASWPLNGGTHAQTGTVYRSWATEPNHNVDDNDDSDSDSDSADEDDDDTPRRPRAEHWFFLPGLGATSRSLAKTGPRVAAVFGRPVTLLRPTYTYGAVADAIFVLFQRLLLPFCVLPARGVYSVYAELRRALLATNNPRRSRVVVLAHNTGATVISQALSRLSGDVPASRLAQLEIYTFGSLAPDFVVPATHNTQYDSTSTTFHVEHVAHANDPCARSGVLRSVRDDLAGRYGGGVFVIGSGSGAGGGNVNSSNTTTVNSNGGVGLGLSVGSTSGFRPVSRGRSFSPPFPPSSAANNPTIGNSNLANIKNRNSRHRMSFPFTYQQQQQYQHFLQNPGYRRSVSASTTSSLTSEVAPALPPRKTLLSMEDYLTALFGPEPWSMRPDPEVDFDGNRLSSSSDAFFLDAAISVDRELAEKREMAAMAAASSMDISSSNKSNNGHHRSSKDDRPSLPKTAHPRLSWTGLGATAKFGTTKGTLLGSTKTRRKSQLNSASSTTQSESPAVAEGLRGLESVRRLCKDYDGRPGREVSVLAGYFSDAVTRHREQFGF